MNFNLYSADHKTWDHVGNITPNVEYCEPQRPHGELMVADWLPVSRLDKHYEHYFVVSAGKVIAFDRQVRIVPAGLKTAFAVTSGDVLTYVATTDAAEGVIDLGTGVTVSAAGAGYTRTELTAALRLRGLLEFDENAEDFVSFPIGVAPYNYLKWAGGDGFDPSQYVEHNYNMQHRIAILCNYVLEMPLVPALQTGVDLASSVAIVDTAVDDWAEDDADGAWYSSTALSLTTRFASRVTAGDDVVALVLPQMDLAKDTTLTPFTIAGAAAIAIFVTEVASVDELSAVGDYFVDYGVGAVLFFETDGDAAAAATGTMTYFAYDSAPSSVSTFACAIGDLKPGDFVRADANSNFVKANVITDTEVETVTSEDPETSLTSVELAGLLNLCAKRQDEIIGQVLDSELHPKDFLQHVRTAYPRLSTLDQMPGSASGGLPTQLTYAGGANKVIRILLLK